MRQQPTSLTLTPLQRRLTAVVSATVAAMVLVLPAWADDSTGASRANIEARSKADRKACLDGRTGQDQTTCLKEAGAARAEALRHQLDNGEDPATLRANAVARCAMQPAKTRDACAQLARGQGVESGSVRGGGVIKEVTTRSVSTPAQPGAPTSAATSSAAGIRTSAASSAAAASR